MAAGNAFLGLAGPVGWTIGGVAIAGSAIYLQQQNAKFAKEATEQRLSVEAELRSQDRWPGNSWFKLPNSSDFGCLLKRSRMADGRSTTRLFILFQH